MENFENYYRNKVEELKVDLLTKNNNECYYKFFHSMLSKITQDLKSCGSVEVDGESMSLVEIMHVHYEYTLYFVFLKDGKYVQVDMDDSFTRAEDSVLDTDSFLNNLRIFKELFSK